MALLLLLMAEKREKGWISFMLGTLGDIAERDERYVSE